jgi:AAA+ superfamily predicted ATPase
LAIGDDEVEGLLADLLADWGDRSHSPAEGVSRARDAIAERARQTVSEDGVLPLLETARAFNLEPLEYDAVLLAVAVEIDARFARIVAYLNDHAARTRPTLGLMSSLARLEAAEPDQVLAILERPVVHDGLLVIDGDGPLSSCALRLVPDVLTFLVNGAKRKAEREGVEVREPRAGALQQLVLEPDTARRAFGFAEALRARKGYAFTLIAGAPGTGRTTLAHAIASQARCPLVLAKVNSLNWKETLRVARREARFAGDALLLVRGEGGLPWDELWSALVDFEKPLAFAVASDAVDTVLAISPHAASLIPICEFDLDARVSLWKKLLPENARADVGELASRFPFSPRGIARSIARATASLGAEPGQTRELDHEALARACREVGEVTMGSHAQKLPLPFTRDDLIVQPAVRAELDLALAWAKHQAKVFDEWGFGARVVLGRGLTALFAGPSGTGKTMAAQVLARELGVDAYRIDLSRVMSKFIGETEKNLAGLFDAARSCGAMLFFDEAEALFGKRSEVSDAHDRYANVEIAYLLQRVEEHTGVVVLATNRMGDLDEAFLRRFQFVIDFPAPEEGERARIWTGMFPGACERETDLDFAAIAREYEMTGGEIKNAALAAAFMAAKEGTKVAARHVRAAVRRELTKAGKVLQEAEE